MEYFGRSESIKVLSTIVIMLLENMVLGIASDQMSFKQTMEQHTTRAKRIGI